MPPWYSSLSGMLSLMLLGCLVTVAGDFISLLQNYQDVSIMDQHVNQYHDGISSYRNLSVTFQLFSCGKRGGQNVSFQLNDPVSGAVYNYTLRCQNRQYMIDFQVMDQIPEMTMLMEVEACSGQYGRNETVMPIETTAESLFSGDGPIDVNGNLITNVTQYLMDLSANAAATGPLAKRTDLPPSLSAVTLVNATAAGATLGLGIALPSTLLTSGTYINGTNGTYSGTNSTHPSQLFHVSKKHKVHLQEKQSRRHAAKQRGAQLSPDQLQSIDEAYHYHYEMFQKLVKESFAHQDHVHGHRLFSVSEHHAKRQEEIRHQRLQYRHATHLNRYGHLDHMEDKGTEQDTHVLELYGRRTFRRIGSPTLARTTDPSTPRHRHVLALPPEVRRAIQDSGNSYTYTQPNYPVRTVQQNQQACRSAMLNAIPTGDYPGDAWLNRQFQLFPNWQLVDDAQGPFYVPEATCKFIPWDSLNATQRPQLPDTIGRSCLPAGFTPQDVRDSAKFSDDDFFNPANEAARPFQEKILDALVWSRDKETRIVGAKLSPASLFKADPATPCPCSSRNDPGQRVCPLNPHLMRNLSSVSGPGQYGNVNAAVGGIQMECARYRAEWFCKPNDVPALKRDNLPQTTVTCCVGDPNCDDQVKNKMGTNVPAWFSQIHDDNLPAGVEAVGNPPRTDWFSRKVACPIVNIFGFSTACECQKVTQTWTDFSVRYRDDATQATNNLQDTVALDAAYSGLQNGFESAAATRALTLAGIQLATDQITATTQLYSETTSAQLAALQDIGMLLQKASSIHSISQRQRDETVSRFAGLQQNISLAMSTLSQNPGVFGAAAPAVQSILDSQSRLLTKMQGQLESVHAIRSLTAQFQSYSIELMNNLRFSRDRYRQIVAKVLPAIRDIKVKYGFRPFVSDGPDAEWWYGIPSLVPTLDQRSLLIDVVRATYVVDTGHLHQRNFALYCSPAAMESLMDIDLSLSVFRSLIGPADCVLGSTADTQQCRACRVQASHLRCALQDPSPTGQAAALAALININQTHFAATRVLSDDFFSVASSDNDFVTFCDGNVPEAIPLAPTLSSAVQGLALTLTGAPFAPISVTPTANLSSLLTYPFHTKTAVDVGSAMDWDQLLIETCMGLGDAPHSYDALASQADALYDYWRVQLPNRSDLGPLMVPLSLLGLMQQLNNSESLAQEQAAHRLVSVSQDNQGIIIASQAQFGTYLNRQIELRDPLHSCDTSDIHATQYFINTGRFTVPYAIQHLFHGSFLATLSSQGLALHHQQIRGAIPRAGVLLQKYAMGSPHYVSDVHGPEQSLPDPWYPKGSTANLTQPTLQQVIDQYRNITHPVTGLPKYSLDQATLMAQQVFDTVNQATPIAIGANYTAKRAADTILQPVDCTKATIMGTGDYAMPLWRGVLRDTKQTISLDVDLSQTPGVTKPSVTYFSQRYGLDQMGQYLSKTGATSAFLTDAGSGTVPSEAESQVNGPALAALRDLETSSSPSLRFLTQHGGVLYLGGYLSCWLYSQSMRTTHNLTAAQAGCPLPFSGINDPLLVQTPPSKALYLYDIPFYMVGQGPTLESRCDRVNYLSLQRAQLNNLTNLSTASYSAATLARFGLGNLTSPDANLTLGRHRKWDVFSIEDFYQQYNFSIGAEAPLSMGTGYNPYCVVNMQPYLRQVAFTASTDATSSTGVATESLTCMGDSAEWQETCWFLYHFQPIWRPSAPGPAPPTPAAAEAQMAAQLDFPGPIAFEKVTNDEVVTVTLEFPATLLLKVPSASATQLACNTNDLNFVYRMPFTSQAQVEFSVPLVDTDTFWLLRWTSPPIDATNYTNSCPESDRTFAAASFLTSPLQDPRKVVPTPNCFPLSIALYRISPASVPVGAARTAFTTQPDLHFALDLSRDLKCAEWVNPDPSTLNRDAARVIQAQPAGIPVHYVLQGITDAQALATRTVWSDTMNQVMGSMMQLLFDVLHTHFEPNRTWSAGVDAEVFPINRTLPLAANGPEEPLPSTLSNISDQVFPTQAPDSFRDPLSGNFTQQIAQNFTVTAQNNIKVITGQPSVNGNITQSDLSISGANLQAVNDQIAKLQTRKEDLQQLLTKVLPAVQQALQVQATLQGTVFTDDAAFQDLLDTVNQTQNLTQVNVGAVVAAFQSGLLQNQSRQDLECLAFWYVNIGTRPNASEIIELMKTKYRRRIETNLFNRAETTVLPENPGSYLNGKFLGGPGKFFRGVLWTLLFQVLLLGSAAGITVLVLMYSTTPIGPAGQFMAKVFDLNKVPQIQSRLDQAAVPAATAPTAGPQVSSAAASSSEAQSLLPPDATHSGRVVRPKKAVSKKHPAPKPSAKKGTGVRGPKDANPPSMEAAWSNIFQG
jgi:hypothetical protein